MIYKMKTKYLNKIEIYLNMK